MSRYAIGLDFGGGGGRCLLLDLDTGATTLAARSWQFVPAPGTGGLGFDIDLESSWSSLVEATREAIARAGARPDEIVALAATSMRLGNVLIDADGRALFAVPNRDARAAGPGLMLGIEHGDALYRSTGRWPVPVHTAARLQWLAAQHPELLERAACVLTIGDWLAFRLSGECASEATLAAESLLLDLPTRQWSDAWITRLGLPRAIFPPLLAAGTRLGSLLAHEAERLGLRAGVPVVVGAGDTQAALLGAGVCALGSTAIVAGTTGPIQQVVASALIDDAQRLWTGHHPLPDRFVLESNCGPLGEVLDWLARLLHPGSRHPVARLLGEASQSPPAARGMLSSLGAEVMNARALTLPVGQLVLSHLTSRHDEAPGRHLARAVVEGMACALRANLEQITRVSGSEAAAPILTGGLSQSDSFARILCDVLGTPLHVSETPAATALGAALCAAVGAGAEPDLIAATARYTRTRLELEPDTSDASAAVYARWTRMRAARQASDPEAAALTLPFAFGGESTSAAAGPVHRPRVLIAADFDAKSLARLEAFADVTYAPFRQMKRMLTGQALIDALAGYDVFVTEIDLVDAKVLAALPGLRVVASCRGDAVNVDIAACTAFGIPVLNTPGRNADAVADLALAFMLMHARKLTRAERFLHADGIVAGDLGSMGKAFATLQGRELWQKTVGLIGLGAVGRKVAQRLAGFGARVIAFDPFIDAERAALSDVELVGLDRLLAESDFVSLHAAVTPETTGLLGAREFARMKSDACLVNTARAALIDESALIDALVTARIGGAALDTFSVEPPGSDHPLMAIESVISTPHIGGNTSDVSAHQGEIVVDDLRRLVAGEAPRFARNPSTLEAFDWRARSAEPDAATLERLMAGPAPAVSDLQKKAKPAHKAPVVEAAPAPLPRAPEESVAPPDASVAGPAARDSMQKLLEQFLADLARDPAIHRFAAGRVVTLHFELDDIELGFSIQLGDDRVLRAAVGEPDPTADVRLRLAAAVLDDMFTGAANAMEAAMDGRLSFTGDAAKAMTLQDMQADLERLYQSARRRVGAPQGLARAARAANPPPGPASGAATPRAAGVIDASDPRHAIVATVRELYDAQVITATGGNVSCRAIDAEGVWITPSRLFKGDLAPDAMVRIDLAGRSLDPGSRSPSSEWDMHCAIYRRRPEVRAVVHAHAPHATILANTGLPFLPISTEAAFFDDLPRVPFIMPGTADLAEATALALGTGWAVLLVNHGLIVAGRSLRSAADMVEIIERTAEILLGCQAVGRTPPVLPDDVVAQLRKMGDLIA